MKSLYFDIRDIFRTPRLALSGKKIKKPAFCLRPVFLFLSHFF